MGKRRERVERRNNASKVWLRSTNAIMEESKV